MGCMQLRGSAKALDLAKLNVDSRSIQRSLQKIDCRLQQVETEISSVRASSMSVGRAVNSRSVRASGMSLPCSDVGSHRCSLEPTPVLVPLRPSTPSLAT